MPAKPVIKSLQRETLFQGWLRVERLTLQHTLFQGGTSQPYTREIVIRPHGAALLPYDPVTDRLCLIEQVRAGYVAEGNGPTAMELVAGLAGPGEKPEAVAWRETLEEAGLEVRRLKEMGKGYVTPGYSTEFFTFYCGEVRLPDEASQVHGLMEENENIRTHILPAAEAIRRLDAGAYDDLLTLFGLSWLARHREALRREWS